MKENNSKITNFIVLVVFCVFAVCVLLVLLTGADVYQDLVDGQQTHFEQRTAARYISTRLRQGDRANSIAVTDFEGASALVIYEEIEGQRYSTSVYCYDGYVRELFSPADGGFSPEDGERILRVQQLSFELQDSALKVDVVLPNGNRQQLTLHLRSGREAAE